MTTANPAALAAYLMTSGQVIVPRDLADDFERCLPDGAEFRSAFLADGCGDLVYWIGAKNAPRIVRWGDAFGMKLCYANPRASARI